MIKKLFIVLFSVILLVSFAEASRKYITSRKYIPVPKTKIVAPHVRPSTGKVIKPYMRAPKGRLKPYYKY